MVLENYPEYTPENAQIYIAGSFNNWQAADEAYRLTKDDQGRYTIDLDFDSTIEFKFTRGKWEEVECTIGGHYKANRVLMAKQHEATFSVQAWLDLEKKLGKRVLIKVTDIPENTPHDASIYIAGSFNGWQPAQPEYRLIPQADGSYELLLPPGTQQFKYKFNRGNWNSVEGRSNGRAMSNRSYDARHNEHTTLTHTIESWEDLDGNTMTPFLFTLTLSAFQGILLIIFIFSLQANNREANYYLLILLGSISLSMLFKVGSSYRNVFQLFPQIHFLPEIFLLIAGPLFYFYIHKLVLYQKKQFSLLHYIPFGLHLFVFCILLLFDSNTLINSIRDEEYQWLYHLLSLAALASNLFYFLRSRKIINHAIHLQEHTLSFEFNLSYLKKIAWFYAASLLMWAFTAMLSVINLLLFNKPHFIVEYGFDSIWLMGSSVTYILGYYAMAQPEILKFSEKVEDTPTAHPVSSNDHGVPTHYMDSLKALMEKEKAFNNPKLTLSELAKMMGTNTHTLSKVINEGYQKNFYDYVNDYRVKAFIESVSNDTNHEYTYLQHAYQVGFNSKASFNRAFKKSTQKTPSEYFDKKGAVVF
ncbi:hypothetical protein GCM10023331_27870 [Algivirga pacifica]|uniref:HTH araC/xylS-type domain-containing protein n=1 Tax=Algivirga pacifica TaxID=1162670 RepID=A0ABP9DEI2_9BACT